MNYTYKIVAFGSSAGGIQPLAEILGLLPDSLNAAIIVIQHLGSRYPSHLPDILQRSTKLPVVKVGKDMVVKKGQVYVIGEGLVMQIVNGRLLVRERTDEELHLNKTIDAFFTSLANDAQDQAIGVILSGGGGFDGIVGARDVEARNGLIIVQDPYTATHPIMPQALIANDHPDFVLSPRAIAEKISERCGAEQLLPG